MERSRKISDHPSASEERRALTSIPSRRKAHAVSVARCTWSPFQLPYTRELRSVRAVSAVQRAICGRSGAHVGAAERVRDRDVKLLPADRSLQLDQIGRVLIAIEPAREQCAVYGAREDVLGDLFELHCICTTSVDQWRLRQCSV